MFRVVLSIYHEATLRLSVSGALLYPLVGRGGRERENHIQDPIVEPETL